MPTVTISSDGSSMIIKVGLGELVLRVLREHEPEWKMVSKVIHPDETVTLFMVRMGQRCPTCGRIADVPSSDSPDSGPSSTA